MSKQVKQQAVVPFPQVIEGPRSTTNKQEKGLMFKPKQRPDPVLNNSSRNSKVDLRETVEDEWKVEKKGPRLH